MKHSLAFFLVAQSIAIGCMMPATQTTPQGSPNGNNGNGDGNYSGGGVDCNAYCSRQAECGMADFQSCANYCTANANDAYFAQSAIDLTDDSCEELSAKAQQQQQPSGGGGGGGGDGSGCRAAAATGSNPVQDCPAMQQCCGGGCHSIGYCSMPTGR